MKARRQKQILDIIRETPVATQVELAEALRARGFNVTQATVSRDIRELGLVKSNTGSGVRYLAPGERPQMISDDRLRRMFRDQVLDVDYAENLVVVKTVPGAAQGVASALDQVQWPGIMGSVAGDDTIFIAVKPRQQVKKISERLASYLGDR